MSDELWIPPERWREAELKATDLAPHIAACEEAARGWVLDYDAEHPRARFGEGVTNGWVVVHGSAGPAVMLEVAVIADGTGCAVIEPTGHWQRISVVDDSEERG